jgi:hypothetical protein
VNPLYPPVAVRAQKRCEYCHAPEEVFNFAFEVEHLTPQSRGGPDDLDNLALSCNACNRFKSDFTTAFDPGTQQNVALFNPRTDQWAEHFKIVLETMEMIGLSATGRATILRLQMNRPQHVAARFRWLQLGLFP